MGAIKTHKYMSYICHKMSDLYGFSEFLFFAHIENKNAFRTVRCSGRLGGEGKCLPRGGVCLGGVYMGVCLPGGWGVYLEGSTL